MAVLREFSGSNSNTIAAGARSAEAFITQDNQQNFAPFNDTIFFNLSTGANTADVLIRFDDDDARTLVIPASATIVSEQSYTFFTVENLDAANTLQINALRYTIRATRPNIAQQVGFNA